MRISEHPITSELSREYISELTETLQPGINVDGAASDFWDVYGSVVLNALGPSSDVDTLYVHGDESVAPFRQQAYFRERPVTIYALSQTALTSDGAPYKYGGYFSGKLLSPNVVVGDDAHVDEAESLTLRTAGDFIANFAELQDGGVYSGRELSRAVLDAYLELCPWYKAYLLKFFHNQDDQAVLASLQDHHAACLESSGTVERQDDGFVAIGAEPGEGRQRKLVKAVSRFWAYGAIEHDSDPEFPDFYFDKADQTIEAVDPDGSEWRNICEQAGLQHV